MDDTVRTRSTGNYSTDAVAYLSVREQAFNRGDVWHKFSPFIHRVGRLRLAHFPMGLLLSRRGTLQTFPFTFTALFHWDVAWTCRFLRWHGPHSTGLVATGVVWGATQRWPHRTTNVPIVISLFRSRRFTPYIM